MMHEKDDMTHVLLAEDDDDDYFLFSLAVNELSFRVVLTRAENGEILMRLLYEQDNPDILFLDLHMPCKDGNQCIKEIRANSKFDSMPVVVYTARSDMQSIEFCYREGSNLYTIKPNNFSELKDTLEKILSINWKKMLYYPPLSQFVLRTANS